MTLKYNEVNAIVQNVISNLNNEKYPSLEDLYTTLDYIRTVSKWYQHLPYAYVTINNEPIIKDHIKYIREAVKYIIDSHFYDYDTSNLLVRSTIINPVLKIIEAYDQQYFFDNVDTIFNELEQTVDYAVAIHCSEQNIDLKVRIQNLLSV